MPGVGQPEQVVTPEQANLPRGVEVNPTPIPKFEYAYGNAPDIQDAFTSNLNLVSGGNVTTADGQTIQTPGILGSAQNKIEARLEEINATGQALAGERGQFGGKLGRLRGPRAVREAEQEKRQISRTDNKASAAARNQVRAQEGRIKTLCAKQHISKDSQTTYSHMIAVEEYLNANPDADDLESVDEIQASLKALNLTSLPRVRIEDRLAGAVISAPGYNEYKTLKIGQGEGDKRTKGLRDFEADLQAAEEQRKVNADALNAKLQETKAKARDWEERYAKFKNEDTPEQRRLKQDHALGKAVAEFLDSSYVPDAGRITQVGEDLLRATGELEASNRGLAEFIKPVSEGAAKWVITKVAPWAHRELRQKVVDLNEEQSHLVDPASRLTQPGAPKALIDMVRKVQAPGFDMAAIPPRERVLAETVTALLGQGVVRVEETSEGETPAAAGKAPGIAGPEEGDGTPTFRSRRAAGEPSGEPEQSPSLTPDQLADQAMNGELTINQLLNLPEDLDISRINSDLTDPASFNTMAADLQASLAAGKRGEPGIRPDDLPLMMLDALKRVAPYLSGYPPETRVSPNDFKTHLDRIPKPTDPANQVNLDAAKRLLAVAQTAYQLRKG